MASILSRSQFVKQRPDTLVLWCAPTLITTASNARVVNFYSSTKRKTPGGGGYSLCDGWYICAAVLTPFFHFGRIEHDLFGVFFSSTNSKAIFWGSKTTNFYENRSFWPQIQFFPRSFGVQFSADSGTPPSVFRPSTPPLDQHSCLHFENLSAATCL